jgi:hypothetical protein
LKIVSSAPWSYGFGNKLLVRWSYVARDFTSPRAGVTILGIIIWETGPPATADTPETLYELVERSTERSSREVHHDLPSDPDFGKDESF